MSSEKRFTSGDDGILLGGGHKTNSRLSCWILSLRVLARKFLEDCCGLHGEGVFQRFLATSISPLIREPREKTFGSLADPGGVCAAVGELNSGTFFSSENT